MESRACTIEGGGGGGDGSIEESVDRFKRGAFNRCEDRSARESRPVKSADDSLNGYYRSRRPTRRPCVNDRLIMTLNVLSV